MFGDFNKIFGRHEKKGGRAIPEGQMNDFISLLNDCDLQDMGFKGVKYTWCNRRGARDCISERLDRFLANSKWLNMFP